MVEFLRDARFTQNLRAASAKIPAELGKLGIEIEEQDPRGSIRLGGKVVSVEEQTSWRHFESPSKRPWVDIVEFPNEEACKALFDRSRQPHSGRSYPNYWSFITIKNDEGLDAVAVVIRRRELLLNVGFAIPFRIATPGLGEREPTLSERMHISSAIDSMTMVLGALANALVDSAAVTRIPSATPDEGDIRAMRTAAFVRLWSEVKHNFVFLEKRKLVDWDRMLELYLPRIWEAETHEEYVLVLQECVALLEDGHTWVKGRGGKLVTIDVPVLDLEPIQGKPVVTGVGETTEMQASGVRMGMELTEINGVPVETVLRERIYPYVFASTPQDRDLKAYGQLLQAEPGSTIRVSFKDINGKELTADLQCNLGSHRDAAPWLQRAPGFEYRQVGDGIAYVAVNTFGTDEVVKEFDEHFDQVLKAKGLIIDVRNNGGGSTRNGYAIIARLIDEVCTQTSKWRSRQYVPVFRAWGREQEWHEGEHGSIEPRGEVPFSGPVAVLIGPRTYSAAEDFLVPLKASGRATLIGAPTGGSTGQPLFVQLYETVAAICTKWDYFPDGTDFVGVGVQPDVRVERTKEDVVAGRDPVLQKAVALLSK